MTDQMTTQLETVGDSDLTLANSGEDIRGRKVLDQTGEEIGDVGALMIDRDEARVRFIRVAAGGFLGIGEKTFLVPVDAITAITDDHITVDQTRDHVVSGPEYDPGVVRDQGESYWADTYAHYGYGPFWAPGYRAPAFPYYGAVGGTGLGDERRTGI